MRPPCASLGGIVTAPCGQQHDSVDDPYLRPVSFHHTGPSCAPLGQVSARDQAGPLECLGRPVPERVRSLAGITACHVGRGVAEVPTHFFERHPVVDEEGRGGVPDPVRTERPEGPATGVIAAGEHERDRVHREGLHSVALAGGDEEPARVRLTGGEGLLHEEWPPALEVGGYGYPALGLEGYVERLTTLAPPEADQRALEVDVLEPQEPHARVPGSRRLEDRDDRPVAQVEGSVSGAASFERPDIVERRALRRRLFRGEERVEGRATLDDI